MISMPDSRFLPRLDCSPFRAPADAAIRAADMPPAQAAFAASLPWPKMPRLRATTFTRFHIDETARHALKRRCYMARWQVKNTDE